MEFKLPNNCFKATPASTTDVDDGLTVTVSNVTRLLITEGDADTLQL